MTGANFGSAALEASHIFSAFGNVLLKMSVMSTLAGAQFIQIFDSATVPADGSVPLYVYNIAANGNVADNWPVDGAYFKNGIVICNSTTANTKTLGLANCFFTAVIAKDV